MTPFLRARPANVSRGRMDLLWASIYLNYSQVVKMGSTKYAREFVQLTTELRLWP